MDQSDYSFMRSGFDNLENGDDEQKQQQLGVRLLYVDLVTHECHLYPHQFNPSKTSNQNAANRHHGGEKLQAISSLLHPESLPTDQSSHEET